MFQLCPDFAEEAMLAFLLILELFKATDEDDEGTIGVAPQDCSPAIGATLPATEKWM